MPHDDLSALIAAALTLIEDDDLVSRLREKGLAVAEAHRAEVMADGYLAGLGETVHRWKTRPSLRQRLRS